MKDQHCPKCGGLLPEDASACPKCGYSRQKQTDYQQIDDAFGDILAKRTKHQAILKKASSLAEKDFSEADEYYRKELYEEDPSLLVKPYFDFLMDVWKKGRDQKEKNLLFKGFWFLREHFFDGVLARDPSYQAVFDAVSEATDVFWATDCAERLLQKHANEMGPSFPLPTVIGWIKKDGRLKDSASVSFAAVATLSNMYKEIERHDVAPALKTFTEDFGLLRLFRLASNPYAKPFAKPFLNFYIQKAERIRGCRRYLSVTKKCSDYKAAAEKEEEEYRKLIALEKEKSATEHSAPKYLDAKGVDELQAALKALQEKKPFQLRNITFKVLQRDKNRADVAFLFPYRVPFDVDAKCRLERLRKRGPIETSLVRLMTSLKRGYLFKSKAEKAKAKAFYADSDWGDDEDALSSKMLRLGSCKTYDKSSLCEIINGGIWNQLPPGMENVFIEGSDASRFALIPKGKNDGEMMYNKLAWSKSVYVYDGKVDVYGKFDEKLSAEKYAYAWVKATIDVDKFEEWVEETEKALTETLATIS